jgi:hypothetical protein
MDPRRVKVELICYGIRSSKNLDHAFSIINPHFDKRTGNAGLQLSIGRYNINAPVYHKFTDDSPYELIEENGHWALRKDCGELINCELARTPLWYQCKTSDGISMSQVLIQEGSNILVGNVLTTCEYFRASEQCKFCAIAPYAGVKEKFIRQFQETVLYATNDNRNYSLHLSGGSNTDSDRGALGYIEIIKAIRSISNLPICVEIAPPETNDYFDMLIDSGTNAFSVNLEIFDDRLRKLFCPAKHKISKQRYFDSWKHLIKRLGKNAVTSVLISGLESQKSTIEGSKILASEGVLPTILPFKPNDGCYLENFPRSNPDEVETISREVSGLLAKYDLDPTGQAGCIGCAACNAENDYR